MATRSGGLALTIAMATVAPAMAQIPGVPSGFYLSACRFLTEHRPAPDVEYTPGVDVRGRPVAPADLPDPAGGASAFDRVDIPVTAAFARLLGFPVPDMLPPATEFGTLTVDRERVLFNGRPIGAARTADLYALCRAR